MATSIATHPIADLDFPTVTVCPPKGSNTALNYDLMKADDTSLTKNDRENLKNETFNLFIVKSQQDYIKAMVAVANVENIKQTIEGFQSVPRPYAGYRGFEVRMWNNNGTWHTPWFGEEYAKIYYEEDRQYLVTLQIPLNLAEQVNGGSLMVQLEVDTREEEGWQEVVSYWEGPKYKLYKEEKTWSNAEAHCQADGGHLASVISEGEQEEVIAELDDKSWVWLGGSDSDSEGVWRWTDGSP